MIKEKYIVDFWKKVKSEIDKITNNKELKDLLFKTIDLIRDIYIIHLSKHEEDRKRIRLEDIKSIESIIPILNYTGPPVFCPSTIFCEDCVFDIEGTCLFLIFGRCLKTLYLLSGGNHEKIEKEVSRIRNKYHVTLNENYGTYDNLDEVLKEIEMMYKTLKERFIKIIMT